MGGMAKTQTKRQILAHEIATYGEDGALVVFHDDPIGHSFEGADPAPHSGIERPYTTQERSVVLPTGFNAWLLDCAPVGGCKVCAANFKQLKECEARDDITQAGRHATEIRDHASGAHD